MAASIGTLQRDTLRRQVEDALRRAIISGQRSPGERLVERELCETLGVSRTSVREALRTLEAERLVRIVPYKGPIVAAMTVEDARELYALRGLLEGFAAREFALHGSDDALARFSSEARVLRLAAEAGDRDKVLAAKGELYEIMLGNCRNKLVREVLESLFSRINLLRATSLMHPDRLPHSLTEIELLAAALCERDAETAEAMAARHVHNACEAALKMLEEQKVQGPVGVD